MNFSRLDINLKCFFRKTDEPLLESVGIKQVPDDIASGINRADIELNSFVSPGANKAAP